MTVERLGQMIDYIIREPEFADSPSRCFKLPFVVTEAFCLDFDLIRNALFGESNLIAKIFSYTESKEKLNPTLGGYLNKIVSFWLIKAADKILYFIIKQKTVISNLFNHLYLT